MSDHTAAGQATDATGNGNGTGVDPTLLNALRWRSIGPYRGGRVVAVAGDPVHELVFYFGSTGGGVWKSVDGGLTWNNVSDGFFQTASVGALAVAPSDPNVIYAGMGETCIRGNVSHGDGVYRSTNGGQTWAHLGLAETRHIAKVRVHPRNPDHVYVAALGHAFGPNPERGVYRSTNGGKRWERILFRSERAGAIDLSLDPQNPRIIYAAFWDAQRLPHNLRSGGPDSGIYKSTDGGDSWTEITNRPGLPKGVKGKIGIAVSPARPERVWALIEAEASGLYRSDDGGESWQRTSDERELYQRPWYYMHVIPDPLDPDTLYLPNLKLWKSTDGGSRFSAVPTPHGDNHDLWIDPRTSQRMIESNDGGACVSFNGGASWSSIYNQPTAEFYHVVTDDQPNYRAYGAQQDNTTLSVPSRSDSGAITWGECYPVGGGESGYIAVRQDDPNIVYAGSYGGLITRYDHRTRLFRNVTVWPENPIGWAAKDLKYRFQWTAPIVLSPYDPAILYAAGNLLFRSRDEGASWEVISPDLTRNDASMMESSGGPITQDNTSVEYYGTIFAFAESPKQAGVLWCGSDDGLVHVSRDNGRSWQNVTPPELPEWALISIIEPSPHDAESCYIAATRYKHDDWQPYLYRTHDGGRNWQLITSGIPAHDFTRVIRADPARRGLLYAGTETGPYVSFDDGGSWQSLRRNLPVVPIHDLALHGSDLIAATHGRGFWILDDTTPLRELSPQLAQQPAVLFPPRPAIRFRTAMRRPRVGEGRNYQSIGGGVVTSYTPQTAEAEGEMIFVDAGANPPDGALIAYSLHEQPEGEIELVILSETGNEIKRFTSKTAEAEQAADETGADAPEGGKRIKGEKQEPRLPKQVGTNRFVWDLRYPDAVDVPGAVMWAGTVEGPLAVPGRYQVQLTAGGQTLTQPLEVRPDPRSGATPEQLQEQFDLLIQIRDRLSQVHEAVNGIRELTTQIKAWQQRLTGHNGGGETLQAGKRLLDDLGTIEEEFISVKSTAQEDVLNYPIRLNNKLAALFSVVAAGDFAPTRQSRELFDDLSARVDVQLNRLRALIDSDLASFNSALTAANVGAVVIDAASGHGA